MALCENQGCHLQVTPLMDHVYNDLKFVGIEDMLTKYTVPRPARGGSAILYDYLKHLSEGVLLTLILCVPQYNPWAKHWRKTKGQDNTDEFSKFVPRNILYFNTLVEEVFTSEKPMEVINNAKSFLADIRGTRWQRATGGGKGKNIYSSLFEGG